ncbi:MAG: hypothetical protein RL385_515, partial [Pseudomonadota bacterium]
ILPVDKYAPSVQRGVDKVYGQARAPLPFLAFAVATFGCGHTPAPDAMSALRSVQESEHRIAVVRAQMERALACQARSELAALACAEANRICALKQATAEPALSARCTQAEDACTSIGERAHDGC